VINIKSYSELLLESLVNESVLYFSPKFRDKLKSMDDDISKRILELEGVDVNSDVTFIDMVEGENALVSFRPMRQAISKIKSVYPDASDADLQAKPDIEINDLLYDRDLRGIRVIGLYNSSGRNTIKVGKFIKKLLGDISDADVEKFVNNYKSTSLINSLKVELVSGKDITFWYDSKNYDSLKGTLGRSCMAGAPKPIFELYEENPEVCQLAIIKRDNKLIARALVWKVESDNSDIKYYMDRPYSIMDHHANILTDWAKSKDMAIWNRGHGSVIFRGKELVPNMKVKVKRLKYEDYPYLDTFRRYDYRKGYLYNDSHSRRRGYILTSTTGGHTKNDRTKLQRLGDLFGIGENLNN
jgi:hypothetical protein